MDVDVHFGDVGANDHLQTNTYKVPEGGTYSVGAFVDSNPTSTTTSRDDDPHNNLLVMSSTDVNETPLDQSLLRRQVFFDHDSAVLTPDAQTTLRGFERDFQDANLDLTNPVKLDRVLRAAGESLIFNGRGHSIVDWALALKGVDANDMTIVRLPARSIIAGGKYRGEALKPIAEKFFATVNNETVDRFLVDHPEFVNRAR